MNQLLFNILLLVLNFIASSNCSSSLVAAKDILTSKRQCGPREKVHFFVENVRVFREEGTFLLSAKIQLIKSIPRNSIIKVSSLFIINLHKYNLSD